MNFRADWTADKRLAWHRWKQRQREREAAAMLEHVRTRGHEMGRPKHPVTACRAKRTTAPYRGTLARARRRVKRAIRRSQGGVMS